MPDIYHNIMAGKTHERKREGESRVKRAGAYDMQMRRIGRIGRGVFKEGS